MVIISSSLCTPSKTAKREAISAPQIELAPIGVIDISKIKLVINRAISCTKNWNLILVKSMAPIGPNSIGGAPIAPSQSLFSYACD